MSQGMFQAGLKPIFANDCFLSACISHKANHPETDVIYGDISEAHTKQKIYQYANKIDICVEALHVKAFHRLGRELLTILETNCF